MIAALRLDFPLGENHYVGVEAADERDREHDADYRAAARRDLHPAEQDERDDVPLRARCRRSVTDRRVSQRERDPANAHITPRGRTDQNLIAVYKHADAR